MGLLLCASLWAVGQPDSKQLEAERQKLRGELAKTEDLLKSARQDRQTALTRHLLLKQEAEQRQQLLALIQEELRLATESMARSEAVVLALGEDLDKFRADYARIVRQANRQKVFDSQMRFLLSAHSLNDAFKRWRYIRHYEAARRRQVRRIGETRDILRQKQAKLRQKHGEKSQLLQEEQAEQAKLMKALGEVQRSLSALKQDEERLSQQLQRDKAAYEKLTRRVEQAIEQAMSANVQASRTSGDYGGNKPAKTDEAALGKAFERSKGRLPWPVADAVVVGHFGKQPHPSIPTLEINNRGIDLRGGDGLVRAIADGYVSATSYISAQMHYMVIVRHGGYFSVYSQVASHSLQEGQALKAGEIIGQAALSPEGHKVLHFEVWKGKTPQNPLRWLKR